MQAMREVAIGSMYNCNIHVQIEFQLKTIVKNKNSQFNCDSIHDIPLGTKRNRDLDR